MPQATVSTSAPIKKIVCPRYEVIFEYIRLTERPLTGLEQRRPLISTRTSATATNYKLTFKTAKLTVQ